MEKVSRKWRTKEKFESNPIVLANWRMSISTVHQRQLERRIYIYIYIGRKLFSSFNLSEQPALLSRIARRVTISNRVKFIFRHGRIAASSLEETKRERIEIGENEEREKKRGVFRVSSPSRATDLVPFDLENPWLRSIHGR